MRLDVFYGCAVCGYRVVHATHVVVVHVSQIQVCPLLLGHELRRTDVCLLGRSIVLLLLLQRIAQGKPRVSRIAPNRDGPSKMPYGVVNPSLFAQQNPIVQIGDGT